MPRCELDHIVVAAVTLEQGAAYLDKILGVAVPEGGKHPLMGTHNRLMQIGAGAFLEIVAIDPQALPPGRPRWYGLDTPEIQARLAERPVLITWVVRTDDIESAAAQSPIPPGPVEEGRRGDLVWKITIPEDGSMPEGGLFPTLIQWPGFTGPAANMADHGCRLEHLTVRHSEPERLQAALAAIGAGGIAAVTRPVQGEPPGLAALLKTPQGDVTLI